MQHINFIHEFPNHMLHWYVEMLKELLHQRISLECMSYNSTHNEKKTSETVKSNASTILTHGKSFQIRQFKRDIQYLYHTSLVNCILA